MARQQWRWGWIYATSLVCGLACATGGVGSADDDGSDSAANGSGTAGATTATGGASSSSDTSANTSGTTNSGTGGMTSATSTAASGSGGNCSESPCKVTSPQCGCANGQKCSLDGQGLRVCIADGNVAVGQSCIGPICMAGSMCLGNQTFANCKKFCNTDSECSAPGGLCIIQVDDGNGGSYKETWCSENCDPVSGTGCPLATGKCEIGQESTPPNRFFTTCLQAGSGVQGQTCNLITDCASGYGCINYNNQDVCAKWCKTSSPSCPGATNCATFTTPMLIGSLEYGACI